MNDEARQARARTLADRRVAAAPSHPRGARTWAVAAVVGSLVIVVFGLGARDEQPEPGPTAGTAEAQTPEGATVEPFCVAFDRLDLATADIVTATGPVATAEIKAAAREVGELAGDTDMGPEATAGVQLMVSSVDGLPAEATADDLRALDEGVSRAELATSRALVDFVATACRGGLGSGP